MKRCVLTFVTAMTSIALSGLSYDLGGHVTAAAFGIIAFICIVMTGVLSDVR